MFKNMENMENHDSLIFQVINTIIYSTFLSILCVYGKTLKVFIKIININVVMKLKRSFPCSWSQIGTCIDTKLVTFQQFPNNDNC